MTQQHKDTEFEAKFFPINKELLRAKLGEIGAILVIPERKMRRALINKKSCPQLTHDYIRVRDEGDLVRLSAKTHAVEGGNLSDQKEIDVIVSDYDKTISIIESLGFKFNVYQETLRETWEFQGSEIVIDTWPGLEPLCEIESESESEVERIAKLLDFDWEKKIITSVAELFAKKFNLGLDETKVRLEKSTFEEPSFTAS